MSSSTAAEGKAGAMGRLHPGAARSPGHLGHCQGGPAVAPSRRPICPFLHRRRPVGKKDVPQQWKIAYRDLTFQGQAHELQHTGLFPSRPPTGISAWSASARQTALSPCSISLPIPAEPPWPARPRGLGVPCGRRQGHGELGPGERQALRLGRRPSAGSSTTAASL